MPPDQRAATTPRREPETKEAPEPRRQWTPIYDEFRLSTPVDWQCPCGVLLHGSRSCPHCGRVPRDSARTMNQESTTPEAIRMRQARWFAKGGR
jgi:hypothetical protein